MLEFGQMTSDPTSRAAVAPPAAPSNSARAFWIAGALLVYGLLAAMLIFITPGMFGFHTYTGIGGSMGDTIPSGSLVLTREVPADQIEVGDVIAFRWPGFDLPITHRVIDIRSQGGTPAFVTKGDGNRTADPFLASGDQEIGRVLFSTPRVGAWLPHIKALIYVMSFVAAGLLWRRRREQRALARARERNAAVSLPEASMPPGSAS